MNSRTNQDDDSQIEDSARRAMLQTSAGLIAAATSATYASAPKNNSSSSTQSKPPAESIAIGKPGDFNFLAGEWRIDHRRLKSPGEWDEFKGEATCWTLLNGVASIEELRIPSRNFSGMGVRVLDVEKKIWSDFWVNAKSGVLAPPGLTGTFKDGVGTFEADDEDNGKKIRVAGIWDRITPKSCRWRQGVSRDGGKTWEYSWFMDWTKV
jgi:hypothetical protein